MINRYACHGLGIVQPIDALAAILNHDTPHEQPFKVVGGVDPRVTLPAIENDMGWELANGRGTSFVWIGHSMGAASGFYLASSHPDWHFKLMITVDPMNWATNIEGPRWTAGNPHYGRWCPEGSFDRWINIHTNMPPGAGVLYGAYDHSKVEDHHFPQYDHINVILMPDVQKIIRDAVAKAAQ